MSIGRTVRLYLAEGTATGILVAEIMNWTGHVLVAPRSKLAEALKRPEASRTGVYLLLGDDPQHPGRQRVYIGEGDSVVDRIAKHAKDQTKDFWSHAYLITSKDANLTKAHVRYLEGKLVELAKSADRASVANGTEPSIKQLPESDVADMEYFLAQLELLLPALAVNVFRPKVMTSTQAELGTSGNLTLYLDAKKHGVSATAIEQDGEFTVLAGAFATNKDFSSNQYAQLRAQLIDEGILEPCASGLLVLKKPTMFASPSAAAAVLLNRNANGRVEWRIKETGQTLKDWQDQLLAGVSSPGSDFD